MPRRRATSLAAAPASAAIAVEAGAAREAGRGNPRPGRARWPAGDLTSAHAVAGRQRDGDRRRQGQRTVVGEIAPPQRVILFEQQRYIKPLFKVEPARLRRPGGRQVCVFANIGMEALAKSAPASSTTSARGHVLDRPGSSTASHRRHAQHLGVRRLRLRAEGAGHRDPRPRHQGRRRPLCPRRRPRVRRGDADDRHARDRPRRPGREDRVLHPGPPRDRRPAVPRPRRRPVRRARQPVVVAGADKKWTWPLGSARVPAAGRVRHRRRRRLRARLEAAGDRVRRGRLRPEQVHHRPDERQRRFRWQGRAGEARRVEGGRGAAGAEATSAEPGAVDTQGAPARRRGRHWPTGSGRGRRNHRTRRTPRTGSRDWPLSPHWPTSRRSTPSPRRGRRRAGHPRERLRVRRARRGSRRGGLGR